MSEERRSNVTMGWAVIEPQDGSFIAYFPSGGQEAAETYAKGLGPRFDVRPAALEGSVHWHASGDLQRQDP